MRHWFLWSALLAMVIVTIAGWRYIVYVNDVEEKRIDKLAEILVLDYRQAHGLVGPTDGESQQQRGES